jgi:RNA polymerase sigma factor (TIGR02999 family)
LIDWSAGDRGALDEMIPLVYDELRRQADRALRAENAGHTLEATALVHEVYFRLVDQERAQWKNRAQFFGMSAKLMRRILIDRARARLADKRGGGLRPITLQDVHAEVPENPADVLALDEALERLAEFDPFEAQLVELRYFAGLTIEETAVALKVSPATVKREWTLARAWLKRELEGL